MPSNVGGGCLGYSPGNQNKILGRAQRKVEHDFFVCYAGSNDDEEMKIDERHCTTTESSPQADGVFSK
jgi:hypothetical protein